MEINYSKLRKANKEFEKRQIKKAKSIIESSNKRIKEYQNKIKYFKQLIENERVTIRSLKEEIKWHKS
jgi:transposase-like protein